LCVAVLWLFKPLADQYEAPAYIAVFCLPLYALTQVQDGLGKSFAWMGVSLVPPYILRPTLLLLGMVAAHVAGLPMIALHCCWRSACRCCGCSVRSSSKAIP